MRTFIIFVVILLLPLACGDGGTGVHGLSAEKDRDEIMQLLNLEEDEQSDNDSLPGEQEDDSHEE